MTNIPNQDILSLVMKQKYQTKYNETTYISYSILSPEEFKEILREFAVTYKDLYVPDSIDIYELCPYKQVFNIKNEGEFFVKSGHYSSSEDLIIAEKTAAEDDIRFQIASNSSYLMNCNTSTGIYQLLNISSEQFYQSFVIDTMSLNSLYSSQRPDLPSTIELTNDLINKLTFDDVDTRYNQSLIDNILSKVFSANSNIIFKEVENYQNADLLLYHSEATTEDLKYSNSNIIHLKAGLPIAELTNSSAIFPWNDFIHGLAHIVADHPCENGFYSCNKNTTQTNNPNIFMLTALAGIITPTLEEAKTDASRIIEMKVNAKDYIIQSLLPWDLAALRYSYGMPEPVKMTYKLADQTQLGEVFGWPLVNNSLVTLSLVGNISIDTTNTKKYALDLRYDHLSNITNNEIDFKFLLSYDTEIAQIIINQSGSVILNKAFKTDIILLKGCYEVVVADENNHQNTMHFGNENYCIDGTTQHINVSGLNSSSTILMIEDYN